ncbi:GNAT family N-acetyltransferase [Desulfoferrobacter suflitae]|uniref:GNAT family N-acetyltransferase n=1 Tax=Desulfoferrobacter suflitae TaxID=2865782 RepID=UPI002164316C|nr:bifunctional acetyl-CoA hydrolase/transferase family protein/GNAT family N-acetyltransferase [Desulfoferrobacter suflitae]MCK8603253.1 GNAT family N-acetyltransferase [Desulfoferrobacter suflitae]
MPSSSPVSSPVGHQPMRPWIADYASRKTIARKALQSIRRGDRVFIGSGCGEPQHLTQALEELVPSLADLEILHILSVGKTRFTEAGFADKCRLKSFFVASSSREAVAEGRADYTPINLGDIPGLFRSGALPLDVALIQVSPPDDHGYCSYGIAVDIVKSAAETARHVIAQVNPQMPRTLGDSFIHVRDVDAFVEHEEAILEVGRPLMNPIAEAIGSHVAKVVEDGSTIRVGVGSISTAVLYALEEKKELGVHADMLTDAYLHLIKKGVITGARKSLHPGRIVASFCLGSKQLYDFADNNPLVAFYPTEYTNNYQVVSGNEKMVSINSALEVDLTGQVCSDSLGYEIYSGVGGATDFLRGARHSKGGKAIIVLPSATLDGKKSRIVPDLTEGGGVVTTRGGVHYVITEYGIAHLHGKSIRERALALIGIAHPDFRESLMHAAQDLNYIRKDFAHVGTSRLLYPQQWELTQIFADDTKVLFRPSKLTDERALKEFFYSLPRDESYVRFLSTMKVFPHYDIQKLLDIDYYRKMNMVGIVGEMDAERIIAIAHYVLDEESMIAELDFAVHPTYARKGIATFLIHHLTEIARQHCIRMLKAYISPGNEKVFGVFQKLGYLVESSLINGVHEIRVHFEPAQACLTD